MKVTVTVSREYEMDAARILTEPSFSPPLPTESNTVKRAWLRESFYELCGFDRDEDHVDGSYVKLARDGEIAETEFDWPESLT